jgi:hypothetical protein
MCWNADVSINTFLFACCSMIFIFVTNRYTRYKTPFFDNPFMYLFFFSVACIQLMEYFLWNHLENKTKNIKLSKLLCGFIFSQPLFLILMIPTMATRYVMLFLYAMYVTTYYILKDHYYTSIGKNGHLRWEWISDTGYGLFSFFSFLLLYIIPVLEIKNSKLSFIVLTLLGLSLLFYFKHHTFGTMWCWVTNLWFFYFLIDILLIQPYLNHSIC